MFALQRALDDKEQNTGLPSLGGRKIGEPGQYLNIETSAGNMASIPEVRKA